MGQVCSLTTVFSRRVGGVVGQPEVAAEHVDALLPVLFPGVGEGGHRVHAGEAFGGGGGAELGGGGGEPFVEPGELGVALPAVGDDHARSRRRRRRSG